MNKDRDNESEKDVFKRVEEAVLSIIRWDLGSMAQKHSFEGIIRDCRYRVTTGPTSMDSSRSREAQDLPRRDVLNCFS